MEFCNERLKCAIDRVRRERSNEALAAFDREVTRGTLLLAVADGGSDLPRATSELVPKTVVPALTTAGQNGGPAMLAFTDAAALRARAVESRIVAMAAKDVLELVADEDYDGLVLNPAGRWVGLTRDDVARILRLAA